MPALTGSKRLLCFVNRGVKTWRQEYFVHNLKAVSGCALVSGAVKFKMGALNQAFYAAVMGISNETTVALNDPDFGRS